MKYLLVVLLLVGCSFPLSAAETVAKKKAPAKTEAKEEAPSAKAEAAAKSLTAAQKTKLLDLVNTGDDDALQSLPGIGPGKAKNIVKGRPYAEPVDLLKVDGIGDGTFEAIVKHAKDGFPEKLKKEPAKDKEKAKGTEAKKKTPAKKKEAAKPEPEAEASSDKKPAKE